jgi:predicted outer membrane repeat protein
VFSVNSAEALGAAILSDGTMTISNSTVAGNTAGNGAAISHGAQYSATFTIKNSIVANSSYGGNCSFA